MVKQPKVGSVAWDKTLRSQPAFVESTIKSLQERARKGDAEAVKNLQLWLDEYPQYKAADPVIDDLPDRVEQAWVTAIAGQDKLAAQSLRDEIAKMKGELLTAKAGVLETALVNCVVISYFAVQRASLQAAQPSPEASIQLFRERQLSVAQKRLHNAVKHWELFTGKKAAIDRKSTLERTPAARTRLLPADRPGRRVRVPSSRI